MLDCPRHLVTDSERVFLAGYLISNNVVLLDNGMALYVCTERCVWGQQGATQPASMSRSSQAAAVSSHLISEFPVDYFVQNSTPAIPWGTYWHKATLWLYLREHVHIAAVVPTANTAAVVGIVNPCGPVRMSCCI